MAGFQNDMLMWLMTEATGVERSVEGFARRLLFVNFAAIHTTSSASVDNRLHYCNYTFLIVAYQ
jgi:hypothetical protein